MSKLKLDDMLWMVGLGIPKSPLPGGRDSSTACGFPKGDKTLLQSARLPHYLKYLIFHI
jgi:hypothetical protein